MKTHTLPENVLAALDEAKRTSGWNNRRGEIKRFTLGACRLIVVPARRWTYRRWEQEAIERQHRGNVA